jgi:hypothetical protein
MDPFCVCQTMLVPGVANVPVLCSGHHLLSLLTCNWSAHCPLLFCPPLPISPPLLSFTLFCRSCNTHSKCLKTSIPLLTPTFNSPGPQLVRLEPTDIDTILKTPEERRTYLAVRSFQVGLTLPEKARVGWCGGGGVLLPRTRVAVVPQDVDHFGWGLCYSFSCIPPILDVFDVFNSGSTKVGLNPELLCRTRLMISPFSQLLMIHVVSMLATLGKMRCHAAFGLQTT